MAYLTALQQAIKRHQIFPEAARRRGVTGLAVLAFVLEASGQIAQVRLVQSSGDGELDQAALHALNQLGRFKPIPPELNRTTWPMRVPIRFDLN
jgi:periplasmic protein TonB